MTKIKAKLLSLTVGGFLTKKDKEEFDKLGKGLRDFNSGIVITPLYSEEGELMSFTIDSKKAFKIINKLINKR